MEREPDVAAMAELVRSTLDRGRVRELRDETWFRWRFRNPLCDYRYLVHRSGRDRELTGYLVIQEHGPDHDTGLNVVHVRAESPSVARRLLRALVSARHAADPINAWISPADPSFARLLTAHGFHLPGDPDPPWVPPALLVLPLREPEGNPRDGLSIAELSGPADWDLEMTASDFY